MIQDRVTVYDEWQNLGMSALNEGQGRHAYGRFVGIRGYTNTDVSPNGFVYPDILSANADGNLTNLWPVWEVPAVYKIRLKSLVLSVWGNTAWTGGTSIDIEDTNANVGVYIPTIALQSLSTYVFPFTQTFWPLIATAQSYNSSTGVITFPSSTFITTTLANAPFFAISGAGASTPTSRFGVGGIVSSNTATAITPKHVPSATIDNTTVFAFPYWAVTGSPSTTSIPISNGAFTAHQFAAAGMYAVIVSGTGAGQASLITDNTTSGLTVATLETAPDTTSLVMITNSPQYYGCVDMGIGYGSSSFSRGAGLQLRQNGAFSAGSNIRLSFEGIYNS